MGQDYEKAGDGAWVEYFGQYLNAIWCMLDISKKRKYPEADEIVLPLLLLFAQYMELWIKTITLNYGIGNEGGALLTGHKILELKEDFLQLLGEKEHFIYQKDLERIFGLYSKLDLLTNEGVSLSEAARYPVTSKGEKTLNAEWAGDLCEGCGVDALPIIKICEELLMLTENVYDSIYESRVHSEKIGPDKCLSEYL